MGSTCSLKIKDEIKYRRSKANEWKCAQCINSVHIKIRGIGNEDLGFQYRCKLMGLGASKRYRIQPDHTCDRWANGFIFST